MDDPRADDWPTEDDEGWVAFGEDGRSASDRAGPERGAIAGVAVTAFVVMLIGITWHARRGGENDTEATIATTSAPGRTLYDLLSAGQVFDDGSTFGTAAVRGTGKPDGEACLIVGETQAACLREGDPRVAIAVNTDAGYVGVVADGVAAVTARPAEGDAFLPVRWDGRVFVAPSDTGRLSVLRDGVAQVQELERAAATELGRTSLAKRAAARGVPATLPRRIAREYDAERVDDVRLLGTSAALGRVYTLTSYKRFCVAIERGLSRCGDTTSSLTYLRLTAAADGTVSGHAVAMPNGRELVVRDDRGLRTVRTTAEVVDLPITRTREVWIGARRDGTPPPCASVAGTARELSRALHARGQRPLVISLAMFSATVLADDGGRLVLGSLGTPCARGTVVLPPPLHPAGRREIAQAIAPCVRTEDDPSRLTETWCGFE